MKKLLLALLAVAAVAVVAVVVVVVIENTPERRMDRRIDKLLRTYDDPKQLYQRVVDDRDLLGFVLVNSFVRYKGLDRCDCGPRATPGFSGSFLDHEEDCDYRTYQEQHWELFDDFWSQIVAELCDCETAPLPSGPFPIIEEGIEELSFAVVYGDVEIVSSGHREVVDSGHPADCNLTRASQDIEKTWMPYLLRKQKEFHEAGLNR